MEDKQPHIQLTSEINVEDAIIVGDPARIDAATPLLQEVEELAYNREFRSITGRYKGKKILVISTGIGAPSTAIGVEELKNIGVKRIIRVGSAGAMQKGIDLGEMIIAEGVVRDDGLTKNYVPKAYPAVPAINLLLKAKKYAPTANYGIVRSHDGFYMDNNAEVEEFWSKKGIIGADMESGALLVIARQRGMEAMSILNNVVLYQEDLSEGVNDLVQGESNVASGEKATLNLALDILAD
ncbi:uridine phosphorylase [Granulicatella balaenopterae]|uniref:Uridine phosphorylase n=1 Tax=Granulicatella balaenopterae TaxID=137733 RepID=A0A1H9MEY3_9LACT|nr:nucleoside phosphorylase [Granulicatella balaenopterae]SER22222.1 uridine phosphorylase [Granulicatella balaenopterae]